MAGGLIMSRVCIFFADGVEEIEGLTVVDMLRRAGISITIVSATGRLEVTGAHHINIKTDALFGDVDYEGTDMLVLPGGMPGAESLGNYRPLCELLKGFHSRGKYIAAICAAPLVLGRLGILEGKKATCFPGFESQLTGAEFSKDRCVIHGNIITSRGMGTAIDFSAELIALLKGRETAENLKEKIMYYA